MKNCDESPKSACCKIESLVTIDDRGQMVLPKEIRKKAGINPGDKLALFTWEKDGEVCCLGLMKVDELSNTVQNIISPIMEGSDK